jgi:hypothetical protein
MDAVHVGSDHAEVVLAVIASRACSRIFILTNSSLSAAAAALQARVLRSAAGMACERSAAV